MALLYFRVVLAGFLVIFLAAGAATAAPTGSYWVFFGPNTGGKSGSKGIYRAKMDAATGKLGEAELAAEVANPSFLAIHPSNKCLYAVGEVDSIGGKKEGGVHAYALDTKTGALTKLNDSTSGGPGPCYVGVAPGGKYIGVANYSGGSCAFFKLEDDGKIGERVAFCQHKGMGPNPERQKEPHAHCIGFEPKGGYAFTVDLGLDRAKAFLNGSTGAFQEDPTKDIILPAGSGPRHFAMLPTGGLIAINGEIDSTVSLVKPSYFDGKHKVVQTLSTLPKDWKGNNSTAECRFQEYPEGLYLYVSNRGHNSIAVFKVEGANTDTPKMTAVGHITGDIKTPRNFNIDPSGKWMLIASQDGDKVGVYEMDPKTGLAKETGMTVKVGKPVCVKFVEVDGK